MSVSARSNAELVRWVVAVVAAIGLVILIAKNLPIGQDDATCGAGFSRVGTRCCVVVGSAPAGTCPIVQPVSCPSGLVVTLRGCDAPLDATVSVERTSVLVGPSDWEAEGRVAPRTIQAGPFRLDRFERTVGRVFCPTCPLPRPEVFQAVDPGRAASDVTYAEADAICHEGGGRLPTEDEWIVAAAGEKPRRYPWGDTGAVCRRAAWGLAVGPCANGAFSPDSVGAHPDGATPSGIHDLAGNVGEWVTPSVTPSVIPSMPSSGTDEPPACGDDCAVVRGGAFDTALATDLRTWRRNEVPKTTRRPNIGFRCAYDVALR